MISSLFCVHPATGRVWEHRPLGRPADTGLGPGAVAAAHGPGSRAAVLGTTRSAGLVCDLVAAGAAVAAV